MVLGVGVGGHTQMLVVMVLDWCGGVVGLHGPPVWGSWVVWGVYMVVHHHDDFVVALVVVGCVVLVARVGVHDGLSLPGGVLGGGGGGEKQGVGI